MAFESPNFTRVPNEFFDKYMSDLNPIACKIFLAICRKTKGWDKEFDAISYSQIMKLTGVVSRSTVTKYLDDLESLDMIVANKTQGRTTVYSLKSEPVHGVDQTGTRNGPVPVHGMDSQKKLSKETHQKKKKGSVVEMYEDEYVRGCDMFGKREFDSKIQDMDLYCESTGKRYKNYFAALLNWFKRDGVLPDTKVYKTCDRGHRYTGDVCERCI